MAALAWLLMGLTGAQAEGSVPGEKLGLFITGLSGSHQFQTYFNRAPEYFRQSLLWNGYRKEELIKFAEDKQGGQEWGASEVAYKKDLLGYLDQLAQRKTPYEEAFIFIGGHANGRDEEAMLHLPGEDLRYQDLMDKLDAIPAKHLILIVAAPQGEAWIERLAKPHRVIVAGNGYRQYDFIPMQFLRYFLEMFVRGVPRLAPGQKLRAPSLLDIFVETQQKIRRWYKNNNLYCTELALIDADGDGKGESLFAASAGLDASQKKGEVIPEQADPKPLPPAAQESTVTVPPVIVIEEERLPVNLDLPDAKMAEAVYFRVKKEENP